MIGHLDAPELDAKLVEAVVPIPLEEAKQLLAALVDKSLLEVAGPHGDRFVPHDLVRLFAWQVAPRTGAAAGRALVDQAARAGLDLAAGLVGELISLLQLPVPGEPEPSADAPLVHVLGILRGSGFGANEWVDAFSGGHGVGSGETDGSGEFAFPVDLGWHRRGTVLLIQAVGRRSDGGGAFHRFTV